jgi:hypothetical protein
LNFQATSSRPSEESSFTRFIASAIPWLSAQRWLAPWARF